MLLHFLSPNEAGEQVQKASESSFPCLGCIVPSQRDSHPGAYQGSRLGKREDPFPPLPVSLRARERQAFFFLTVLLRLRLPRWAGWSRKGRGRGTPVLHFSEHLSPRRLSFAVLPVSVSCRPASFALGSKYRHHPPAPGRCFCLFFPSCRTIKFAFVLFDGVFFSCAELSPSLKLTFWHSLTPQIGRRHSPSWCFFGLGN